MKLYLVQSGIYYKIGITADWNKRYSTLQTGNPHDMHLLKLWDVSDSVCRDLEKRIHQQLKRWHHRGEWFTFPDDLVSFLMEICEKDLVNNYRIFDGFLMRKKVELKSQEASGF